MRPITVPMGRIRQLDSHLMLFYTGIKRTASDVAKSYVEDLDKKKTQLRIMKELVKEGIRVLNSTGDIAPFGELLHETWQVKRKLSSKTTNSEVDDIYDRARKAGALGGKLTGAGGGGFMLMFAPPERQEEIKKALSELICVPFKLEPAGSQIIFFDPEEDYSEAEAARASQAPRVFRELTEVERKDERKDERSA